MKIFGIGGPEIAIVLLIALWVVSGFIAKGIGEKKGYGAGLSFCAGFFLFILGIIIMAVLPDKSGKEKAVTSADALKSFSMPVRFHKRNSTRRRKSCWRLKNKVA